MPKGNLPTNKLFHEILCFIFQDVDAVFRRHFILQYTLRNLFHQVGKQQDLIYSRIGHIVFCDKQHKETDILQAESQVGFGMCDCIKTLAMVFIIGGHACLFIASGPVMDAEAWDRVRIINLFH